MGLPIPQDYRRLEGLKAFKKTGRRAKTRRAEGFQENWWASKDQKRVKETELKKIWWFVFVLYNRE